jgi:coenzyme Q-binding protein COQ10
MLADIVVGFKGLRESFTSKVTKQRPTHIHVDYVEGPLKFLRNEWDFRADGDAVGGGGCLVDFTVEFQFKSRIFEAVAGQVFGTALRRMIGAFEERARRLYGAGAPPGISKSSATSAA